MYKNQIQSLPQYFDRYISHVPDLKILDALHHYGNSYFAAEKENLIALGDQVYAQDKWTIKDILQHIIDTERIFAYRALRFARKDSTPLAGFDENAYAASVDTSDRTVEDLLLEFAAVRQSTLGLYIGFSGDVLHRQGEASGHSISVLALGFTMVGHGIHHMNIIKERYYPLLKAE